MIRVHFFLSCFSSRMARFPSYPLSQGKGAPVSLLSSNGRKGGNALNLTTVIYTGLPVKFRAASVRRHTTQGLLLKWLVSVAELDASTSCTLHHPPLQEGAIYFTLQNATLKITIVPLKIIAFSPFFSQTSILAKMHPKPITVTSCIAGFTLVNISV